MPREPTKLQKLVMKARRWPLTRKIKTREQAQMAHEEALKELQRRRDFFEEYKDNFDIISGDKKLIIRILDDNKNEIGSINLTKWTETTWYARQLFIGQFGKNRDKYRDLGFGKAIMKKAIIELKKLGAKQIIFDSLNSSVDYYLALGAKIAPRQEFMGTTRMYFEI